MDNVPKAFSGEGKIKTGEYFLGDNGDVRWLLVSVLEDVVGWRSCERAARLTTGNVESATYINPPQSVTASA